MRIAGFAKLRDEILKGNLNRVLEVLESVTDGGVVADDASHDGTREHLRAWVKARPSWQLLEVPPEEQDFAKEIAVKQKMLELLHVASLGDATRGSATRRGALPGDARPSFDFVLWLDGDEALEQPEGLRAFLEGMRAELCGLPEPPGYRMHYTQLWRNASWARTDQGFDDGSFVKLWRYRPDLSFDTTAGTHKQQFPKQINYADCPEAPFEIVHYGNVGKNLVFKATQYSEGRGGVDRHIGFGHSPEESLATGQGFDVASWSAPHPTYRRVAAEVGAEPQPLPFTLDEIKRIRSFGSMRDLKGWFTVVLPTFNRAKTLPKALESLLFQTYDKWICVVLDDGSTDETPALMREWQDRDPRIFYARYHENRGGVAMNEIGMALACEWTEYWSRLGSDDWFGPKKLERDAACLAEHGACYGEYYDSIDGRILGGEKNPFVPPALIKQNLLAGRFLVGWANVACHTEVLRKVREKYGMFGDPRLRNCEDFLLNARIATVAEWTWRDSAREFDAAWNVAPSGGASSPENAAVLGADEALTRELIAGMR